MVKRLEEFSSMNRIIEHEEENAEPQPACLPTDKEKASPHLTVFVHAGF